MVFHVKRNTQRRASPLLSVESLANREEEFTEERVSGRRMKGGKKERGRREHDSSRNRNYADYSPHVCIYLYIYIYNGVCTSKRSNFCIVA